jgi:hypothetical protein
MSKYLGKCWQCDTCQGIDNSKPWPCMICGREVCENCFDMYMTCDICASQLTRETLKKLYEDIYL